MPPRGRLLLVLACLAGPAWAQEGRRWTFTSEGDYARLAYGDEKGHDKVVSFSCTPGSGRISIYVAVPDETENEARVPMRLTAGGKEARLRGEVENTGIETAMAEAKLPATHPALQALAREGRLRVEAGPAKHEVDITAAIAQDARMLLAACGRKGRR